MEGREDRWGRGITLSCLLDPCCCNQWCLLYFSTVLPYLLLKQSYESFMHRKLKNIAHEYMDDGSNQESNRKRMRGNKRDQEK